MCGLALANNTRAPDSRGRFTPSPLLFLPTDTHVAGLRLRLIAIENTTGLTRLVLTWDILSKSANPSADDPGEPGESRHSVTTVNRKASLRPRNRPTFAVASRVRRELPTPHPGVYRLRQ